MEFSNYQSFLDKFFLEFSKTGIDITGLSLDHIAYKVSSMKDYVLGLKQLSKFADLKRENEVRGRKVGMLKLKTPWIYKNYVISAIEIIAPKDGEFVKEGYEHVEFLLNEPFESFMLKYPKLNFDTSVMNEPDFPMIKLRLTEDMQVKFPKYSILN